MNTNYFSRSARISGLLCQQSHFQSFSTQRLDGEHGIATAQALLGKIISTNTIRVVAVTEGYWVLGESTVGPTHGQRWTMAWTTCGTVQQ